MALKKVHSVDYAAGSTAGQTQVGVATSKRSSPLTHSISIVVELAREPTPSNECEEGTYGAREQKLEEPTDKIDYRIEGEHSDEDDDDGDEDEDDDEGECLSSELARKIVLVDEADKILRIRAASAEPAVASGAASVRAAAGSSARFANFATPTTRQAGPTCRGGGCRCCGGRRSIGGSSGELAERGELSELGARRNTHHQLVGGVAGLSGGAGVQAAAASAHDRRVGGRPPLSHALSVTPVHLAGPPTSPVGAAQTSPLLRNWPAHRRQSLQISLLSGLGGGGAACSPCKFLNEEELRGEREFNEQVRSAKSPDSFGLHLAQPKHQPSGPTSPAPEDSFSSLTVNPDGAKLGRSAQQQQPAQQQHRCRSTGGLDLRDLASISKRAEAQLAEAAPATTTGGDSSRKYQPQAQRATRSQQAIQKRRVSFSCIDPVIPSSLHFGSELPADLHAQIGRHRASIAYQPPGSQTSQLGARPLQRAAGVNLDRPPAKLRPQNSAGSSCQLTDTSAASSPNSQQASPSPICSILKHSPPPPPESQTPRKLSGEPASCSPTGHHHHRHHKRHSLAWESRVLPAPLPLASLARRQQQQPPQVERPNRRSSLDLHLLRTRAPPASTSPREMDDSSKLAADQLEAASVSSERRPSEEAPLGASDSTTEPLVSTTTTTTTTTTTAPEGENQGDDSNVQRDNQSASTTSSKAKAAERNASRVQSIMANAKLRQEEFARLLEEHEQIVNEINRFETKISSSQTNLQ